MTRYWPGCRIAGRPRSDDGPWLGVVDQLGELRGQPVVYVTWDGHVPRAPDAVNPAWREAVVPSVIAPVVTL